MKIKPPPGDVEFILPDEPWIPLKDQLPPPCVKVLWYDAMCDEVMLFALPDPSRYDGDFTHWMPRPSGPKQYARPAKAPTPMRQDARIAVRHAILVGVLAVWHKKIKNELDVGNSVYDNLFNKAYTWAIKEIINETPPL
jgi:hypothetical protein